MPGKDEILNKITPDYMTLDELSAYCAMSKMTLRRWLNDGMPHYRFGRSISVKVSDFDAWVSRFRSSGSAAKDQVLNAWNKAAGRSNRCGECVFGRGFVPGRPMICVTRTQPCS